MKKLLPPTHLLRAFLATAEYGTVARASEALHLTAGAVSKQISELETWLAVPLFDRVRKKLVLTAPAMAYRDALLPAIGQLEAATLDVMRSREGMNVIYFALPPTLGERWLDPLLPEFTVAHPMIELRTMNFVTSRASVLNARVDAYVTYGASSQQDTLCEYLLGREIVLIAPPCELMKHPLSTPDDLRHHELIHHEVQPDAWRQWCQIHRLTGIDATRGPHLTLAHSIISAVGAGVGVGLVPLCLVTRELAEGRLIAPFPPLVHEQGGYFLNYPTRMAHSAAFGAFKAWLLEQARRATRELKALTFP